MGWLAIALVREDDWRRMCTALERPDLLDDPRFASFATRAEHESALQAQLRPHIQTRPRAAWLDRLRTADVISDAVNTLGDWVANPHVQAIGAAIPTGFATLHVARTPGAPTESDAALTPAPAPGQHTRDILAECGFAPAEIEKLIADGIAS